jgi:RIO-like serine/threonine protein kinase
MDRRLKSDLFGVVLLEDGGQAVRRDTRPARRWLRPLARHLARREARALLRLEGLEGTPRLLGFEGGVLRRVWVPGQPMQLARPTDPAWFREALTLLRRLHRAGVAHNDLAKEPNWLVTADGRPALVDFQLALVSPRRGRLFRALAREDLRHLLKHKRTYCAERLTARQRRILATPAPHTRLWRATGKRLYTFVTRRLLGWADREGAGDRNVRSRR